MMRATSLLLRSSAISSCSNSTLLSTLRKFRAISVTESVFMFAKYQMQSDYQIVSE